MPWVTDQMIFLNARQNVMQAEWRVQEAIRQQETRVQIASDDPGTAGYKVLLDHGLSDLAGQKIPTDNARKSIGSYESDMSSLIQMLTEAKRYAVQASNELNPLDRATMAAPVGQIHDAVLAIANSQDEQGNYKYSGYKLGTLPFDAVGTYSGDSGLTNMQVSPNLLVTANLTGNQVFTVTGGSNILKTLNDFTTALGANDITGITAALQNIDGAINQIAGVQATIGGTENALLMADGLRDASETRLKRTLSDVVQTNVIDGFSRLMQTEASFDAAIKEVSRILQSLQRAADTL